MIIPLVSFYVPWKHHRTSGFLMLSNGIKRKLWHEMGYKGLLDRSSIFAMDSCVSCSSCLCFYTWYLMDLLPFTAWSTQKRSFFWSVFSSIRTEYGEIRSIQTEYGEIRNISLYSVQMRENTNQKKLRIWTLSTQCLPSFLKISTSNQLLDLIHRPQCFYLLSLS